MQIKTIGVVGAGTMGTGIAQVCALAGRRVILRDIDIQYVETALARIEQSMTRAVEKGKLSQADRQAALAGITKATTLKEMADADLVIEAALEDLELKKSIFGELNHICRENTIFATNTSSMSITDLGAASGRPDRFCGIHFFNPAPVMRLVEVISGMNTAETTIQAARSLVEAMGKTPVHVKKDAPGFIVNRLLIPYMNEAARMLSEGIASPEDIDTAVRLGLNYPMGPFEMLDMGGIDLSVTILDYFAQEYADAHYAPQLLLRQMIRAGKLGKKSGEGFYRYQSI